MCSSSCCVCLRSCQLQKKSLHVLPHTSCSSPTRVKQVRPGTQTGVAVLYLQAGCCELHHASVHLHACLQANVHHPDTGRTLGCTSSSALHQSHLACCLQADAFVQGLQTYLQQHALGTATSAELWAAVAAATGQPVGDWMQKWTYESGFPLLNVTLSGAGGLAVSVSQASAYCCTHVDVFGSQAQALQLPAAFKVEVCCLRG